MVTSPTQSLLRLHLFSRQTLAGFLGKKKPKSQWLAIRHKAELVMVLEGADDMAPVLVNWWQQENRAGLSRGIGAKHYETPVIFCSTTCLLLTAPASHSHLPAGTHLQDGVLQHFSIFDAFSKIFLAGGQKEKYSYKNRPSTYWAKTTCSSISLKI